ncbi:MAG: proton-conducting transporter transmembrane domain-containing protein [Leptospirales bacterium]
MVRSASSILMDVLVLLPLAGVLLVRFSGQNAGWMRKVSTGVFWAESVLAVGEWSHLVGQGSFRSSGMAFSALILAALCVPIGLISRGESSPDRLKSLTVLSMLMLFFSAGFTVSPSPIWSIMFWTGGLFTVTALVGAFPCNGEECRETWRLPVLMSFILFPLSQALSGHLPGLPLFDRLPQSPAAFGFASLAFLVFCPFFPFQRWLSFVPVSGKIVPWIAIRLALLLLSVSGLFRWAFPLEFSSFSEGLPVLLGLSLMAQIQGALQALNEPVLRKRLSIVIFSQTSLLVPALFLAGRTHPLGVVILVFSFMLPALLLAMVSGHLEDETRRQRFRDWSGLYRFMPRADRLFLIASLGFSAVPGFGAFSGVVLIGKDPSLPSLWIWSLLSLPGIVLVQSILWQSWESIFLGPFSERALIPRDIPLPTAWKLAAFLLPVLFLGIWPGVLGSLFWKGSP